MSYNLYKGGILSAKKVYNVKEKDINGLTLNEIKQHVNAEMIDRMMDGALRLASQEKKLNRKAIRVWEGIIKFQPFRELNELYALLVADAFLRKNEFKFVVTEDKRWFADYYCWNINYVKYRKAIKGNFLEVNFDYEVIKSTEKIWDFANDYPVIVETIKDNLINNSLYYERNVEDE